VSRALPDTLASDSFLGPLQEMGIKEAHPERSYHCRGVQEEERELQIGNVSKAMLRPTPGNEANTSDNTRDNAGEGKSRLVTAFCRVPRRERGIVLSRHPECAHVDVSVGIQRIRWDEQSRSRWRELDHGVDRLVAWSAAATRCARDLALTLFLYARALLT
jgi:hypothetical protein